MGIYDEVRGFKAPCAKCGVEISEWQTKDGDPYLHTVDYQTVNHFYAICPKCGHWNEYGRKMQTTGKPDDFVFIERL